MNHKTKRPQPDQAAACLCRGAGPALSELIRRLAPSEEARAHFDAARLEFLKGLRTLLDARIDRISKSKSKGEKIKVD